VTGESSSCRALLLFCWVALACAPTYHTAQRYRFDHAEADQIEVMAEQVCPKPPEKPFITDGCTLWPDGSWLGTSWQHCCVEHDAAYWCGGSREMRAAADEEVCRCVDRETAGIVGWVMWLGSRAFASPWMPAHWRWGYGNDYPAGYD
jgi:hypothetical protein